MSKILSEIRTDVKVLVRDRELIVGETDYDLAIRQARIYYTRAFPYKKIGSQTGDGSTYEWTLPSDYYPDFSTILEVRFPADQTSERRMSILVSKTDYDVFQTATGTYKLRLLSSTPTATETLKYVYTTIYSLTETTSTLPSDLAEQSVTFAAAALVCEQLAAYYAQSVDATISADSVNFGMKSADYKALADRYKLASGIKEIMDAPAGAMGVACAFRDLDAPPTYGLREQFLTHTRR